MLVFDRCAAEDVGWAKQKLIGFSSMEIKTKVLGFRFRLLHTRVDWVATRTGAVGWQRLSPWGPTILSGLGAWGKEAGGFNPWRFVEPEQKAIHRKTLTIPPMPKSNCLTILLFICLLISPAILTARPLNNLSLPGDQPEKVSSDSDGSVSNKQTVPCETSSNDFKRYGAGNYGSLFLSALPKGTTVPPSGPSRRTNAVNN
ncbi:hypothetical protein OSB04_026349 [Centaurea solstitialis]|uniref:Uncharacterized protein n=1 Tax=Centaurea solstitialis TaxID=347529 RepID=A0AA38SWT3_9ASTR|nr:hypothetical protein OSB04_026349 [Centaurea solstitialis]